MTFEKRQKYAGIGFALALLLLNALMNLDYPAAQPSLESLLLPSAEVWILVLGLLLWTAVGGTGKAGVALALTGLFVFLRLFRLGDILVPMYFFRPFSLYMDLGYLPDLAHLLYHSFAPAAFWIRTLGALGVLVILTAGVFWAWRAMAVFFATRRHRTLFLALSGALLAGLACYLPFHPQQAGLLRERLFLPRVAEELQFIWNLKEIKAQGLAAVELAYERVPSLRTPLDKLRQADVAIFFIESYGQTVFADPHYSERMRPALAAFQKNLAANGFETCSSFLVSPTFGGTSWLALGTLESGVRVDNQMKYNYLLNSKVTPLARFFNRAGYLTVSVMPGTTLPWPQGVFFGYQRTYYAWDFDYQGPRFDWSPMPDQFVLEAVAKSGLGQLTRPVFWRFELTSSHAPFSHQPPYLAEWSRIGDGSIYRDLPAVSFPVIWPDLSNAAEAYISALAYDFKLLGDYLPRCFKKPTLIIILGDHQPNGQLTGHQASWSVPVHVISNRQDLLQPFIDRGYTLGMTPVQPLPHKGMETFLADFLTAFSSS
jgi:hypothetical protein